MRRLSIFSLAACLAVLGTSGCTDFLSSDKVSRDPNNPSEATADQLFIAVQAGQFAQQEGIIALVACMWMQQCTGTSNFLQVLEQYGITSEDTPNPAFSAIYEGGGLVDIRKIEAAKAAAGDQQYLGIVQVWEAIVVAVAADIYGDVPYREAASDIATPALDPQAQVYSDLQALLDEAITNLGGTGPGPGVLDLVFGGNTTKWIEAANTLKARLYMHTVERDNNLVDNAALNSAVTSALLGISDPANDLKSRHTSRPGEDNMWYQFKARSGFGNFVVAGRALVDLMVARSDPRLPEYFSASDPGPYGGLDPFGGRSPGATNTVSLLEGTRNTPTFAQPIVTYIENELILAEAYYRLGQPANAQTHFDNARASVPGLGAKTITSVNDIMEEKYVAMFQNIEVWNDYKRSCYPAIAPVPTGSFGNKVPGRLFYGTSEANANPNVPGRSVQLQVGGHAVSTPPASPGFRNPNDPNACP
ncbi:MAG TPA: SusD/RagB family nutrient-binding outer membrane lipoprotein [Gemmatimonadales bacterium]|nr:SusD/RagB family nutrient-binding outer membrane lipoprotein [Gemmatimonadales bacterium]